MVVMAVELEGGEEEEAAVVVVSMLVSLLQVLLLLLLLLLSLVMLLSMVMLSGRFCHGKCRDGLWFASKRPATFCASPGTVLLSTDVCWQRLAMKHLDSTWSKKYRVRMQDRRIGFREPQDVCVSVSSESVNALVCI